MQSAVAWREGEIVLGPAYYHDAINRALRLLGVEARGEWDEFDTIGLGWHRDTDEWLTDIRE